MDARFHELEMVVAFPQYGPWKHRADECFAAGDEPAADEEGDGFEGGEEECDPRVVLA